MSGLAIPDSVGATSGGEPSVVIVVVTYNSAGTIVPFLRALGDALEGVDSSDVIVVDNASRDDTVDLVRTLAPWATVLEAEGNLGYGAGINVGLRHAIGRRGVLVLNPDAVLARGAVRRLLDAVDSDESTGIAVPRIEDSNGELKFSMRREPTLRRALGEALLGGHRAARFASLGEYIRDPNEYVDGATADWATGAAMLVSRRALNVVGLWAEDFFLYGEETDYALRVRDAGFRLRYVADAVVIHPGGEMDKSPFLWSTLAVNRVRLYRKRHGSIAALAYWCVVVLNEATRAMLGRSTHAVALKALFLGRPLPPS